ncbi:uncharacterized protein [Setaria viridis]|uniref:Uncharacterized protein n=1 Tax=Setaria viridis TaxID=4556 RepID=A0A4U6VAL9_SETVI|nr:hypothetical protein SEVIR_3G100400v2 [Setaria viridis]
MGSDANTQSAEAAAEKEPTSSSALLVLVSLIVRVAAIAVVSCSLARSAWLARGDLWDLAFIAGAGAVLAALFWCLRQAERLTPGSSAVERWRLKAAVWFLSTVLSCAFAYRVSLVMLPALVVLIWCMTSLVVLAGFVMLVLCNCKDYKYQCLAFIAGVGAVLAALFWCLRQAERLTPGSPAVERWRLKAAVWFLSTVLSCAFAYRVSLVMPPALVVLIWCMTSLVVLVGFVMLVLCNCKDQQYQCLDEVNDEAQARRRRAALALACWLRVTVIAFMACSVAPSAWRARQDPVELAVVAGPIALLAALFVCLHRAERLTPGSPPGQRRRLHVVVWVLSMLTVCLSAYQISRALPAVLAIAVWPVTSFFVLWGFYMLVLRKDHQYQELDGVDCDAAAGDANAFITARPADDLV